MDQVPPKVFISHASEDKARFVEEFAAKLREKGVDAWLDKWEMLPGDSLIDKIFEEGIKQATAFIIVLSENSTKKKWVKEELNAAAVARVEKQCKVIPVVIDECEVPEVLKSTLWQKIETLDSYEDEFKRIVASIFGQSAKPPIGEAPAYTKATGTQVVSDLNPIDTTVFLFLCKLCVEENSEWVTDLSVLEKLESDGIANSDIADSLEILDHEGYIQASKVLGAGYNGTGISSVNMTLRGLDTYLREEIEDFSELTATIISLIVNDNISSSNAIIERTGHKSLVIEYFLDLLESNGLLNVSKHFGGATIHNISPKLKRMLDE